MSTQVSVASTTYSLNDGNPYRNYLKTLLQGRVIMHPEASMADTVVNGVLEGPALRIRRYTRWAYRNPYASFVGVTPGLVGSGAEINETTLKAQLDAKTGGDTRIIGAQIDYANLVHWADQYLLREHPDEPVEDFLIDTNEEGTILIMMKITPEPGEGEEPELPVIYTTPLVGYVQGAMYMYAEYSTKNEAGDYVNPQIEIYRRGTGNAVFDSYFGTAVSVGSYIPPIPVRRDNRFYQPGEGAYTLVKNAIRKAFPSGNYDKLVRDLINNNPRIGDINFANIVFGVPINTPTAEGREYIVNLMHTVTAHLPPRPTSGGGGGFSYGGPLSLNSIQWNGCWKLTENRYIGPVGTCYIGPHPGVGWNLISFIKQTSPGVCYHVYFSNLFHSNHIYKTNSVATYASIALQELNPAPFIFPLDLAVFNQLGLKDANQFGNHISYMVFNSYTVNKTRWYKQGILDMVMMIVVVAVAATTAGTGAAGAGGLLGSPASVGGALGFTGSLAIYIGTILNAVAAMVLMKVIQKGATKLLGEEAGMLIGTIAGVVALAYGASITNGQSFTDTLAQMTHPQALTRLTSSVGQGYAEFLQKTPLGMSRDLAQLEAEAARIQKQIEKLSEQNLRNSTGVLNALSFVDALIQGSESRESFLQRTLMTGTDIAELSIRLLEDYVNISLDTTLSAEGS